jgi:aspartyl-tRNA(Asn)/glutamyl-tRNA(Gln) amidotransferase subunit A
MSALSDLLRLDIASARTGLAAKDFSARELTEAYLAAADVARPLNGFITETPERALDDADAADARIQAGEAAPMTGMPIAQKDLFCTEGVKTTAASKILGGFTPPYESTVSGKLKADGAVLLGKANLDEFAMGSANITSAAGPVTNPWTPDDAPAPLTPGGSSGGSAALVAAGAVIAATGTDTGGSIRQPAALCGVVGMKPTYGRCSRWGVVAFASSLDQPGPITRSVRDAAIMLGAIAGHDPKDSTSANVPSVGFEAALAGGVKGMRVGVPREYRSDGMPEEIDALWREGVEMAKAAGAEIVDVSLPMTRMALPAYYIVALAEASSNLARYDGVRYCVREEADDLIEMYSQTRGAGFGEEVRRRILIGTYVLSAGYYDAYYKQAQKVRTLIANDFNSVFNDVDVLLAPTTPSAAFAIGEKIEDPVAMYMNDIFTVPASMAGLPAISVPAGLSAEGLPLGLQVIGRPFDEASVLKLGLALEDAAGFDRTPRLLAGAAS